MAIKRKYEIMHSLIEELDQTEREIARVDSFMTALMNTEPQVITASIKATVKPKQEAYKMPGTDDPEEPLIVRIIHTPWGGGMGMQPDEPKKEEPPKPDPEYVFDFKLPIEATIAMMTSYMTTLQGKASSIKKLLDTRIK